MILNFINYSVERVFFMYINFIKVYFKLPLEDELFDQGSLQIDIECADDWSSSKQVLHEFALYYSTLYGNHPIHIAKCYRQVNYYENCV
jgi:hypothetical protein